MRLDSRAPEPTATVGETAPVAPAGEQLEAHGLYRVGLGYGRLIYRVRWLIIAVWLVGLAVSVPFASKIGTVLTGGGFDFNQSESSRAANILAETLHQPPAQLLVVFRSTSVPVTDPAYQLEVRAFVSRAQFFSHVISVAPSPVPGADGLTTFVTVNFDQGPSAVQNQLKDFRALLPTPGSTTPASAYVTGNPAVYDAFTRITQSDTEQAEQRALPLALLVLLVVFGSVAAAAMPLVLALVAVPIALAIIYAIALHSQTSVFVLNVASIVGLGISIDYSLFMTRRFREELANGRSVREAVGWTVATAGEAILFSGLTVMIGFAGLLLIGIQFMSSFGIGGALVVLTSVLAALTLLPALLSVLGHRINALRLPLLGRLTMPRAEGSERQGFWHGWALAVMRRPVLIVLAVTVILIGLGWPIFSLSIGTPTATSLPKSSEARQGLDILSAQYPGATDNPVYVVAQTPDGTSALTAANLAKISDLSQWLATQRHVTGVISLMAPPQAASASPASAPPLTLERLANLYSTGMYITNPALRQLVSATTADGTTVITVNTDAPIDSAAGKQLIDTLRAGDRGAAEGLMVSVGGFQAVSLDFNRYLYGNFPKAILFILLATYVLLLLMFRSAVLPLKAILMNVLSVSAAYGVLVFIFQQGHFATLLGFEPTGFLDSTIPILLFCILFGLSMDYEVFLLSRIREEWLRTGDNRYAVARGLEKTGGVITNAALLFIIIAGSFAFTSIVVAQETGLGMAVAVLVDATIIRTLLVPATMRLLGRWNWWLPGRPLPVERNGS
ncbi:MAG: MMPL family transporter [Ktedonobacterales bacterium]|nr:MMPL family transporter [Ktedonobacterales bacterium]